MIGRFHVNGCAYQASAITREVDFTPLEEALSSLRNQRSGSRIAPIDFFSIACVKALRFHPRLNASLIGDEVCVFEEVNLKVALNAPELGISVIRGAHEMGLAEISEERERLTQAATSGEISPFHLEGETFTIVSLGHLGVDAFTPIINPPRTACLGIGRALLRPWVVKGSICARPVGCLSVAFDYRIVDLSDASHFLADIALFLEQPRLILG